MRSRRSTSPTRSCVSTPVADGPEAEALLADEVGLALLVVLEALTPAERLAFVLHDLFGVPFASRCAAASDRPSAVAMSATLRAEGSRLLHGANAVAGHTRTYAHLHPFVPPGCRERRRRCGAWRPAAG